MKKKDLMLAVMLAVCGVLLHSTKAVMIKLIYQENVDSSTVLLWRMLFALPLYLVIGFIYSLKKKKQSSETRISAKTYFHIGLLGFIGYYLSSYFDFVGLQYIDASLERLVLFAYPTITFILTVFLNKGKFKVKDATAILITYVGIFLVFYHKVGLAHNNDLKLGVFFVALCSITYALYLVGSKYVIDKVGSIQFTIISMVISSVCVILHYMVLGDGQAFNLSTRVYTIAILMAVFSTVIPSFMVAEAIKRLGAAKVGIISSLGPISTISLSILLLGEVLTLMQVIGGFVVVFGVLFLTIEKKKNQ